MPQPTEQVDNPDHSLFRPPWNATKQSYAKQRGKVDNARSIQCRQFRAGYCRTVRTGFGKCCRQQHGSARQSGTNDPEHAAQLAEANSQQALDVAQKLSHQLRAAEARIAELESEGQSYQDRAERAEQWLHRVYSEIEDRFLKQGNRREAATGAPRRNA
jgi:hypothetical protein